MSLHTHAGTISAVSTVATVSAVYKEIAFITMQVMAFLGLIFLLHSVAPTMGGLGLFVEILGMAFAGMCAAVICYYGITKLSTIFS